jgi:hypothetical protein
MANAWVGNKSRFSQYDRKYLILPLVKAPTLKRLGSRYSISIFEDPSYEELFFVYE